MNWPARHPRAAIAIALFLLAAAGLSIARLKPDTTLTAFFSPDDPAANTLQHVATRYATIDELLVLATADQPNPDALLRFAADLQQQLKGSERVASFSYRADAATRQFVEKVIGPAAIYYLSDTDFAAAKQRLTFESMQRQIAQNQAMLAAPGPAATALAKELLKDPLRLHEFLASSIAALKPIKTYQGSDAFLSADGRSLLIRIAGVKPTSDLTFSREFTAEVSAAVARVKQPGVTVDLSGGYAIAAQSERMIRADTQQSVTGSVVLIAALFALAYRRPVRLFLMSMTPLLIGTAWGFGLFGLYSDSITPLTAVVGAILAGMGIDYAIEYLSQYYRRRSAGRSAIEAAGDTIHTIGPALLAACATSIVGFAAVALSSVRALRDFAIIGGLGIAGAFVATLWILPALLVLVDRDGGSSLTAQRWSLRPLIDRLQRRPMWSVGPIALLAVLALVYALVGRSPLVMESDLTVLHPRPNPPLEAERKIAAAMGFSPGSLVVHLRADSPEQLVRQAHRVRTAMASNAARAIGVTNTISLANFLPDPGVVESRRGELSKEPADRTAADFLRAIDASDFSAEAYQPYAEFLRQTLAGPATPTLADLSAYPQLVNAILPRTGDGESLLLVLLNDPLDSRDRRNQAIGTLRSLLADESGATLTGMAVLSQETELQVKRDLPRLAVLSIGLVAAYLLVHFRAIKPTLLAVLPCAFGLICWAAVMKLTDQKLNLANLAALPLLLGINTDYGIFVVSLSRRLRDGESLGAAMASSSQAISLCALTTFFGFGSLALTSVPAIQSLGWAVGVGVAASLLATVFLLVPILLRRSGPG